MSDFIPQHSMSTGIVVLDARGYPIHIGEGVTAQLGPIHLDRPLWESLSGAELKAALSTAFSTQAPMRTLLQRATGDRPELSVEPIAGGGMLIRLQSLPVLESVDLTEQFRLSYEQSPDGFIVFQSLFDEHGRVVDFRWLYQNPAAGRLIGRTADSLLGKKLLDVFPENREAGSFERYCRVAETGVPDRYEFKFVGQGLDTFFRTTTTRVAGGITVLFNDIQEEVLATERQRVLAERYRLLVESTNDVIRDWDLLSGEVIWNESLETGFGYPATGAARSASFWVSHLHPDDREQIVASLDAALASGEDAWRAEYRFMRHDGSVAVVLERAKIARDEQGKARRLVGSLQDVTEHRQMEEQQRRLTEVEIARQTAEAGASRLRTFIEHLPVAVAVLDRDLRYLAVSDRWLRIRGLNRDAVMGRSEGELFPETLGYWKPIYDDVMSSGILQREVEMSWTQADGKMTWWRWEVQPWHDGSETSGGVSVYLESITEARQLEQAQRQLELDAVKMQERTLSFQRLERVFEQVPAAVAVLRGPEHVFEMANEAYQALIDHRQTVGRNVREVFPDLVGKGFFELLDQVYTTGEPFLMNEADIRLETNGTWRQLYANFVYAPLIEEGKTVGVLVFAVDVTQSVQDRQKVELLEQRARSITEAVAQIVWTNSAEGRMTGRQALWQEFTGQTEAEYEGYGWSAAIHPDDVAPTVTAWQRAVSEQRMFVFEHRVRRHDGVYRTFSVRAVPVLNRDGSVREWVGAHTDITERREQQRELERLSHSLRAQNQMLGRANEQLRQVDQLKSNFISSVSHEIRTPLTSIKSFAKILQNDLTLERLDADKRSQFLGIINEESDRLTRLINDVLDIAKMESGKMNWNDAPVSLAEIAGRTVLSMKPMSDARQVRLGLAVDPDMGRLLIDPDKVQQVFVNLLSNAIKFTPAGGRVELSGRILRPGTVEMRQVLETAPRAANRQQLWYHWSVSDTGTGIPAGELEKIFEQFHQVTQNDALDKPKGTGLGLPISRHIVEHYGGRIWATSTPGEGSVIHVLLPSVLKTSDPAPSTSVEPVESAPTAMEGLANTALVAARRTVLVVDDEPNIRTSIRYELERHGWRVLEAGNGLDAVELARSERPNLITLDIMMPDLSGFDVISVLKSDASVRDIPILMVSILDDVSRGFQLGAADYLAKPLNSEVLMEKVLRLTRPGTPRPNPSPTGAPSTPDEHAEAPSTQTIVLCSADPTFGEEMVRTLTASGCCLYRADRVSTALELLRQERTDVLLIDSRLPEQQRLVDEVQQDAQLCDVVTMVATPIGAGLSMVMVTIGCLADPHHEPQIRAMLEQFRRLGPKG